jgi:hypothetical protein
MLSFCDNSCTYLEYDASYDICTAAAADTDTDTCGDKTTSMNTCIGCQQVQNSLLQNDLSYNISNGDILSDKTYSEYLDSNSNELTNSFSFFYNKTILEIVIDVVGIILIAIIASKKILNKSIIPDAVEIPAIV